MYLLPLGILAIILLVLVEVFSIAMKMTGLDIEKARFQVLTLLTSTGFTTRESELIVQHSTRRKIAKMVMIFGYVATATLVTVLFRTLTELSGALRILDLLYLLPGFMVFAAVLMIMRSKYLINRLDHFIEFRVLASMQRNKRLPVEEVLKLNEEYGVAEVIIDEDSPLIGKALKDSGLKSNYIQVLNIEGATHMIHFPTKDDVFELGDKVVVYGRMDKIKAIMH